MKVFLHQTEAINALVEKYNLKNCKPALSPLDRSCYSLDETKRIDDSLHIDSNRFVDLDYSGAWST